MALTKKDLDQIDLRISKRLRQFATKDEIRMDFERFRDEINDNTEKTYTKFRDDFYTKIDPILKEVKDNRDERVIMSNRINRIETKLSLN